MDLNVLGSIGFGILVLVWVGYRQTTWRPVEARMWRLPLILGLAGFASVLGSGMPLRGIDLAALAIELVVSAATWPSSSIRTWC